MPPTDWLNAEICAGVIGTILPRFLLRHIESLIEAARPKQHHTLFDTFSLPIGLERDPSPSTTLSSLMANVCHHARASSHVACMALLGTALLQAEHVAMKRCPGLPEIDAVGCIGVVIGVASSVLDVNRPIGIADRPAELDAKVAGILSPR
jgi:hypothetical protein